MKPHIVAVLTISLLQFWRTESAPVVTKTRQFLPPLPGYIPVYIRPGNTPLEDINLDLAEAFQSYALKQGRLDPTRTVPHVFAENDNEISSSTLDHADLKPPKGDALQTITNDIIVHTQHVQKIPKVVFT